MDDGNPLTELYLNLLARAIDKERCNEAHPAFVKIIEQLSPDEAMVMWHFQRQSQWEMPADYDPATTSFPVSTLVERRNLQLYVEHLAALNLLQLPEPELTLGRLVLDGKSSEIVKRQGVALAITITTFGKLFVKACVSVDFDPAKFKSEA